MTLKKQNLINQDTKSIGEYMQSVKSIIDELAFVHAPIVDEDLVISILNGLNKDFKQISTTLQVRETPITYKELFEKLSYYEGSLNHNEVVTIPAMTTNNIQRGKPFNNYQQYRSGSNQQYRQNRSSNNPNYKVKSSPHNSNYQNRRRNSSDSSTNGNKPIYQLCGKYGHTTRVCRNYNIT